MDKQTVEGLAGDLGCSECTSANECHCLQDVYKKVTTALHELVRLPLSINSNIIMSRLQSIHCACGMHSRSQSMHAYKTIITVH